MQLADGNRWRMPGTCSTCGAERCLPGTFQQEAAYRQKGSVGGTQLTIVAGGPLATAASSTPSVAHDPRSMVQPPLCAVGGRPRHRGFGGTEQRVVAYSWARRIRR